MKDELQSLQSLKAIEGTLGFQSMVEDARNECLRSIDYLANCYSEATLDQLLQMAADLKANLRVYKRLTHLDKDIDAIKTLLEQSRSESSS